MTQQRQPGAFRYEPGGINLFDQVVLSSSFPYMAVRSKGCSLIDAVSVSPGQSQHWSLLSVAFQVNLGLVVSGPTFGLLGKVIAGLLPPNQPPITTSGTQAPFVQPMIPLPNDTSLLQTIWDPAIDPAPPQFTAFPTTIQALLPCSTVVSLPEPIELVPGEQLSIGLWSLPEILGNNGTGSTAGIFAQFSSYAITYDDGL